MDFVEKEFNEITEKLEAEKHEIKPTWRELITRKSYRKRIVLCALLQTFGQLTGINCIQYYAGESVNLRILQALPFREETD